MDTLPSVLYPLSFTLCAHLSLFRPSFSRFPSLGLPEWPARALSAPPTPPSGVVSPSRGLTVPLCVLLLLLMLCSILLAAAGVSIREQAGAPAAAEEGEHALPLSA